MKSVLFKIIWCSFLKPRRIYNAYITHVTLCGVYKFIVNNILWLRTKQWWGRMNGNRLPVSHSQICPIKLQLCSIHEESFGKTVPNIHSVLAARYQRNVQSYANLSQLFSYVHDTFNSLGVDEVFMTPLFVATDGFVSSVNIQKSHLVTFWWKELLAYC